MIKTIKIYYHIPENSKELEELIGKAVGVKISSANSPEAMIYFGIVENEFEFLQQGRERKYPLDYENDESMLINRIWGWRNKQECLDLDFCRDGIKLCPEHKRIVTYSPDGLYNHNPELYETRLELLKVLDLWEDAA